MNTRSSRHIAALSFAALILFVPTLAPAQNIRTAVGPNAADAGLLAARDGFRLDLGGGTVQGANGSFGGVRREINWDGVPAAQAAPNNLAANFFNSNSPRGVIFSTLGTGFRVSGATTDAGAGQPAAQSFGDINPTYTATFGQFTAQRLFTAIGSNVTDVNFFIPGTATTATVTGFGSIFTDVDTAGTTTIQYFDQSNASLGTFIVPVATGSQGLSFLGVSFSGGTKVSRVQITSGNAVLGPPVNDGGATDLVVMDDFIYSEPVPEPSTLGLCAAGLAGLLSARKRNRRVSLEKATG